MTDLPTRAAALATGAKRYMGGPCREGHNGERYTKGGKCCTCVDIRVRAQRASSAYHRAPNRATAAATERLPEEPRPWGLTPRQMRMAAEAAAGLRRTL